MNNYKVADPLRVWPPLLLVNDGAGIPEERRADAIRPFIRLEKSRNRRTGGNGLGLSITSDIILSHGGALTLGDSHLGGLRVSVKLPM